MADLLSLLSLMKVWMVPLVFESVFSGNKLKCELIMSSGPENPAASLHRIDVFISTRVTDIQVAFLDAEAHCSKLWWFSEVLLSPCGYI